MALADPLGFEAPGWVTVVYAEALDPGWPEDQHPRGIQEGNTITVWPSVHGPEERVEDTVVHELGHLYDVHCLTREDRKAWMEERGILGSWHSGPGEYPAAELYAEEWMVCHGGEAREWILPDRQAIDCQP